MAASVASYTALRASVDALFAQKGGRASAAAEAPKLLDLSLQSGGVALARAQQGGSTGDLALAKSVRRGR